MHSYVASTFANFHKHIFSLYDINIRSDFVAPYDERHLPAPGVDKGRPAGVDGQVFPTAGAHPQR